MPFDDTPSFLHCPAEVRLSIVRIKANRLSIVSNRLIKIACFVVNVAPVDVRLSIVSNRLVVIAFYVASEAPAEVRLSITWIEPNRLGETGNSGVPIFAAEKVIALLEFRIGLRATPSNRQRVSRFMVLPVPQ